MGSSALGTSTVLGASLGARKLLKTKSTQGPDFCEVAWFQGHPCLKEPTLTYIQARVWNTKVCPGAWPHNHVGLGGSQGQRHQSPVGGLAAHILAPSSHTQGYDPWKACDHTCTWAAWVFSSL